MMIRTIAIITLLGSLPLIAIAQGDDEHDHSKHAPGAHAAPVADASGGGSIAIRAIQSTKGGPAIANDQVVIEILTGHGKRSRIIDAKLDEHGVAIVEGLALSAPFRPRVTVKHAGGSYETLGEVMNAENPTQEITVKVFETTEIEPDWNISMSHLAITPASDGLVVTYILVANNPTDLAWLAAADVEGNRYSIVIDLPSGASKVKTSAGFHSCCTKVVKGKVLSTTPFIPGATNYKIEYLLPITNSEVELILKAPAPISQLRVFFPHDPTMKLETDSMKSLGLGRYQLFGENAAEFFAAEDVPAGKEIKLTISGVSRPLTAEEIAGGSPRLAKIIAALGTLILLIPAIIILLRKPQTSAAAD